MPGELFITGNAPEGNQQLNSQTSAAFSGASIKKGADCIIDEINITPPVIRVIIIGILILILLSSVISSKENTAFHFYIGKMRNFYLAPSTISIYARFLLAIFFFLTP